MCNSAAKPDPTRPTRTFAMSALLSEWARILYGNPVDWFAAEHHACFTLPWTGRVGSEHFASCRGGVIQLHPHPARVLRTLHSRCFASALFKRRPEAAYASPLQGEVGECCRAECERIIRIQYELSWPAQAGHRYPPRRSDSEATGVARSSRAMTAESLPRWLSRAARNGATGGPPDPAGFRPRRPSRGTKARPGSPTSYR